MSDYLISAIFLIIIFFPFLILLFCLIQSKIFKPTNNNKSEMLRPKITNSMSKYILYTIISIIMLIVMSAVTYKEAKPISFMVLIGLVGLLKYNYKIYLDLTVKDGLIFSGTLVKIYTQTPYSPYGRTHNTDFNYTLEIETDNGNYIKCASKVVGLIPGQRIENAYVSKRTNLLLYYDKTEYS